MATNIKVNNYNLEDLVESVPSGFVNAGSRRGAALLGGMIATL